jgi:2',3'-cyclic-nucleotide 2'-phosphodiesterase (5'-nucleotidase family)
MRKHSFIALLLSLLVLLTACVFTKPPTNNGKADAVYLFAINDTHGALYTEGDYPGLDRVAGLLAELEKNNGEYVKIAGGDIFQGSYISNIHYGLPLLSALNEMGFDAFVLGNHEFDWGLDKIARYADGDEKNGEADFPFLAANVFYNGEKLDWTRDYTIVEKGGRKVGIIGVIGYGLESSISADKVAGYQFYDPIPIVRNLAAKLRSEEKCDLVIVACHDYSQYFYLQVAAFSEASFVDAIVCGHTHQYIEEEELREDDYVIPIIQSDDKNESVGEIVFRFGADGKLQSASMRHYDPMLYKADEAVAAVIAEYEDDIEAGERVIAYTVENLSRSRLGEEMTRAMKEKYGVDVAIINTGGVRESIGRGLIRVKDVYEVFPFDNRIILTGINGRQLNNLYHEQGPHLYFSSFAFYTIDEYATYQVAIVDYVYYQSYYTDYFTGFTPELTDDLMRDVFIEYLEINYEQ